MKLKLLLVLFCFSIPLITGLAQEIRNIDFEGLLWRPSLYRNDQYLVFVTHGDVPCWNYWEPDCERQLVVIDRQDENVQYTLDYTGYIEFAVSPSGDRLGLARTEGEAGTNGSDVTVTIEFRSLDDGELLSEWELPAPHVSSETESAVFPHVVFSEDLGILYRYSTIRGQVEEFAVFAADTREMLFEESCETASIVTSFSIYQLTSPDGKYLLHGCIDESPDDDLVGYVSVTELASGRVVQEIPVGVPILPAMWSSDSSYFAFREGDFIRVHDLKQEIYQLSVDRYVIFRRSFSSNSRYFYVSNPDSTELHVFDLENDSSNVIEASRFDADTIEFVSASPFDNRFFIVLSSSDDEITRLLVMDMQTSAIIQQTVIEAYYGSGISSYNSGNVWYADGQYVSLCQPDIGDGEYAIHLWNIETGMMITVNSAPSIYVLPCEVNFSSDRRYAAFFRSYYEEDETISAMIVIMELSSQEVVYETILDFESTVTATLMEWETDNRFLYIDPLNESIMIVDLP